MKKEDAVSMAQRHANKDNVPYIVAKAPNGQWLFETETCFNSMKLKRTNALLISPGENTKPNIRGDRIQRTLWIDRHGDDWAAYDYKGNVIPGTVNSYMSTATFFAKQYASEHDMICVGIVTSFTKRKGKKVPDRIVQRPRSPIGSRQQT